MKRDAPLVTSHHKYRRGNCIQCIGAAPAGGEKINGPAAAAAGMQFGCTRNTSVVVSRAEDESRSSAPGGPA